MHLYGSVCIGLNFVKLLHFVDQTCNRQLPEFRVAPDTRASPFAFLVALSCTKSVQQFGTFSQRSAAQLLLASSAAAAHCAAASMAYAAAFPSPRSFCATKPSLIPVCWRAPLSSATSLSTARRPLCGSPTSLRRMFGVSAAVTPAAPAATIRSHPLPLHRDEVGRRSDVIASDPNVLVETHKMRASALYELERSGGRYVLITHHRKTPAPLPLPRQCVSPSRPRRGSWRPAHRAIKRRIGALRKHPARMQRSYFPRTAIHALGRNDFAAGAVARAHRLRLDGGPAIGRQVLALPQQGARWRW